MRVVFYLILAASLASSAKAMNKLGVPTAKDEIGRAHV